MQSIPEIKEFIDSKNWKGDLKGSKIKEFFILRVQVQSLSYTSWVQSLFFIKKFTYINNIKLV